MTMSVPVRHRAAIALLLATVALVGCGGSALTQDEEQRLTAEGIVRRAENVMFRKTHDRGTRDSGWEEAYANIIVTKQSVVLWGKRSILLQVTPRSTGDYDLDRRSDRLALHAGSGKSEVTWGFRPPDDAEGWATDIRAVIDQTAGAKRQNDRKD